MKLMLTVSLIVIVFFLLAALSSRTQNRERQSESFVRALAWLGYGIYGVLAAFFLVVGVVSLLGLAEPEAIGASSRLPGVPLLILGVAGLWYSVWRLGQHGKRHGIGPRDVGDEQ